MSRFGDRLRQGWRGMQNQAATVLAGIVLFLLAFVFGLHLFFPTAAVRRWLSAEIANRTPVSVQLSTLSLRPVFTLRGRDIVAMYNNRPVTIDELMLKPLWGSLVTGDPGIVAEATLLQGQFTAALRRSGNLALHAAGMKLTDVPVHPESKTLLSGTVVKGDLLGSFPAKKATENRLLLEMDNTSLTVMGQPLALGKISIQGNGQGNSLRITTLTATGGDIVISGTGALLFGISAAASRVNFDLTLRPAASASPTLVALLDLAAKRQGDGSYSLRLSGPLNQLTVERQGASREQPRTPPEED